MFDNSKAKKYKNKRSCDILSVGAHLEFVECKVSVNASVAATFASSVQPSLALTRACDVAAPCPSHSTKDHPEVGEVLPPAPAP